MQAFEIRHLRVIASIDKGIKTGLDQLTQAAAENRLLTKEIGFAFLPEAGFDHAGPAATNGRGIGQADIMGIAGGILMDRKQAGNTATLDVFTANRMAGAFRGDHDHVNILGRDNQIKVNVEPMGESQGRTGAHAASDFVFIDFGLKLIRGQHHQHIGPFGGLTDGHDVETGFGGLGAG